MAYKLTQSFISSSINHSNWREIYDEKDILGEGSFGRVFKAQTKKGEIFAIKLMNISKDAQRQMFLNEVNCLSYFKLLRERNSDRLLNLNLNKMEREKELNKKQSLSHLLQMIEHFEDDTKNEGVIVMKFYEKSFSLDTYISQNCINERTSLKIFAQIMKGISFMHQHNMYHRDIKLANFLYIPQQDLIVIIDFGLSELETKSSFQSSQAGTLLYQSPQQLTYAHFSSEKSDIWSLGVILYFMLYNKYPLTNSSQVESLRFEAFNFIRGEKIIDVNPNSSDVIKVLLAKMLAVLEENRLKADEILRNIEDSINPKFIQLSTTFPSMAEQQVSSQYLRKVSTSSIKNLNQYQDLAQDNQKQKSQEKDQNCKSISLLNKINTPLISLQQQKTNSSTGCNETKENNSHISQSDDFVQNTPSPPRKSTFPIKNISNVMANSNLAYLESARTSYQEKDQIVQDGSSWIPNQNESKTSSLSLSQLWNGVTSSASKINHISLLTYSQANNWQKASPLLIDQNCYNQTVFESITLFDNHIQKLNEIVESLNQSSTSEVELNKSIKKVLFLQFYLAKLTQFLVQTACTYKLLQEDVILNDSSNFLLSAMKQASLNSTSDISQEISFEELKQKSKNLKSIVENLSFDLYQRIFDSAENKQDVIFFSQLRNKTITLPKTFASQIRPLNQKLESSKSSIVLSMNDEKQSIDADSPSKIYEQNTKNPNKFFSLFICHAQQQFPMGNRQEFNHFLVTLYNISKYLEQPNSSSLLAPFHQNIQDILKDVFFYTRKLFFEQGELGSQNIVLRSILQSSPSGQEQIFTQFD